MFKKLFSSLCLILALFSASVIHAEPSTALWSAGKYYGGHPTLDKYLTQGITFRISPDKKTMKDINIQFPADFHDEMGNVSRVTIHFSQTGIEPLTLRRISRTQSQYFAYLDEFNNNWNTELRIKWNPVKKSFKITINSQSDPVEDTYYKASATLSLDARKGRAPR